MTKFGTLFRVHVMGIKLMFSISLHHDSASPAWMVCAPLHFLPEAHNLFTVVQATVFGKPAYIAACLAGACPVPA
jgi:hypothetical protein